MHYRFRTWAIASEEVAGARIEVASDGSLDEGDCIIRTVTSPSIASSGAEFFVQFDREETDAVYWALHEVLDKEFPTEDEAAAISRVYTRLARLRKAAEVQTMHERSEGDTDDPYLTV